jgi:ABC-type transport system substrate-binding protein
MKITVQTDSGPESDPTGKVGPYIVSVLDDLGYHASLGVVNPYAFNSLADSRKHEQIGLIAWLQDVPTASSFIGEVLTCPAFHPRTEHNPNVAEFCDPSVDAQLRRGAELQTRNPAATGELWNRSDRELTDQAPWVPLYNPRAVTVLSERVGNYQYHPFWQVMLDQLWVR